MRLALLLVCFLCLLSLAESRRRKTKRPKTTTTIKTTLAPTTVTTTPPVRTTRTTTTTKKPVPPTTTTINPRVTTKKSHSGWLKEALELSKDLTPILVNASKTFFQDSTGLQQLPNATRKVIRTTLAPTTGLPVRNRHTTTPTVRTTLHHERTTPSPSHASSTTMTTTTQLPTESTTMSTTLATANPDTTTESLFVDDEDTAYFAFKIEGTKISKRVHRLCEAALNVSRNLSPFLIDGTNLYQPLISFYLEDDEANRTSEIFDQQLEAALCPMLPRRIPYTEFRLIDGAVRAMSQTGEWMNQTKSSLRAALNREGFIFHSDLDENLIVIMNPLKLNLSRIDLSSLKLAASAYVDRLYICRGHPPTAEFTAPCDVITEFPLQGCASTFAMDSPTQA